MFSSSCVPAGKTHVRFDSNSCTFTQVKLCICECGEVPAPLSPLQLTYCMKSRTHRQIIDFIIITQGAYFPPEMHCIFLNIPQPALRCCTVPIWIYAHTLAHRHRHTHSPHHTQCLVFRFIKPQCYPEWLTGWGTVQKSPPAGIHSHYHWEKASLVSALVTARGGTTN